MLYNGLIVAVNSFVLNNNCDQDFVYATASGANTFTVKAVDQAGNTSEASNGVTEFC